MQNPDISKSPPTSGTNERKYSPDEIKSMLYHFDKHASEVYAAAQKKITDKLAKHNIPLSEYTAYVTQKEQPPNRCCGRCNGIDDICVADMVCEPHQQEGCEICYGPRQKNRQPPSPLKLEK